ncbi:RDD family protein [Flavobacterium sp.]|uniref:RDD family protein n=1 Tax=Flavobacterium sp. TaxID=239 RepID=UPI002EDB3E7B
MIIYGRKTVQSTIKSGKFDCPNCRRQESYQLKNYQLYFHIFFIPLLKIRELGDELNCFFCNTTYVPGSVLSSHEYDTRNRLGNTSQEENTAIGLVPCDFGKRIGAFVIDLLIIYALNLAIAFISPEASLFVILFAFIYFIACDLLLKGSSLGKLALSIKTVNYEENGEILAFNVILRNLIKGICAVFPLIYLTSLLNQDKRALHDLAARTMVVDK